jgi:hypothetical protein
MKRSLFIVWLAAWSVNSLIAGDAYYFLPIRSLKITSGSLLETPLRETDASYPGPWRGQTWRQPRAVLDRDGEVYVVNPSLYYNADPSALDLAFRVPEGKDITGRLFLPSRVQPGFRQVQFALPAGKTILEAKTNFARAKAAYYRTLLDLGAPGAAWFRHQEQEALNAVPRTNRSSRLEAAWRNRQGDEAMFDLFSGGRAVSENLRLDRLLEIANTNELETIELTSLNGITVQAMDWKALLKDAPPESDPLAGCIPADQHALFFSSFKAMTELMDEADLHGTLILQMVEPRGEDARTRPRYQKQLCLELSEIARVLGPMLVQSTAFTGSDPYLPTGSDVGLLFDTKNPEVLAAYVTAKHAAAKQASAEVQAVKGEIDGVAYSGVISSHREISSYVASIKKVVLISNSRFQLGQLIKASQGKLPTLASLDEYRFFRQRYVRTDPDETAFLMLSDATIRRWCGPQWRILSARRTRAAAALAEMQAVRLDDLAKGQAALGPLESELKLRDLGEVTMTTNGITSSVYGSLDFLTPIAEIPLTKVTASEADAYHRWRNLYQANWRRYFDPIAARFALKQGQIAMDLTVMPLIAGTDYAEIIRVTSNAKIKPDAGDPHTNSLLHVALAINSDSEPIKSMGRWLASGPSGLPQMIPANPLGWLGESLAVYIDQDPIFQELGTGTNRSYFLEHNFSRLPVALAVEVKNPMALAAFLLLARSKFDSTTPGLLNWQNLEHHGQAYVKVTTQPGTETRFFPTNLCVFYLTTPDLFLMTFQEALLQRAIDRHSERAQLKADSQPARLSPQPWLGESLGFQVDKLGLELIQTVTGEHLRTTLQALSWANLPILNEWRRRYPTQDPVAFHERYWQTRLICPAGGAYVWNEQWQTMESTACGHPNQPKQPKFESGILNHFINANLGLSFEPQGLRGRVVVNREPTNK